MNDNAATHADGYYDDDVTTDGELDLRFLDDDEESDK
jgi:hypothetical protein